MCSIFGYISDTAIDDSPFIELMKHRGPDGHGVFHERELGLTLGHGRLSIIDLSSGADQPMVDSETGNVIVFNGEIYNYAEIRTSLLSQGVAFRTNSDTEVILHAYRVFGSDLLDRLRGMFAFVIYDKLKRQLFAARDRFGIKPFYYLHNSRQFAFSSEVGPLAASGLVPRRLSRNAINDFFWFGSVQQPNTIYEGIEALMPGKSMTVDLTSRRVTHSLYYDCFNAAGLSPLALSYPDAVQLIRNKLEEATRYHLVADVEVGAFLSGGVDSSAVVALMSQVTRKPIRTYSVGFADRTEVEDETSLARKTAEIIGCIHTDVIVQSNQVEPFYRSFITHLDQPSIDGFNTFLVSAAAGKEVKVVLSGLGGDEVFAGYSHFASILRASTRRNNLVISALKHLNEIRPNRFTSEYAFRGTDPYTANLGVRFSLTRHTRNALGIKPARPVVTEGNAGLTVLQQVSKSEFRHYLLNTLLRDSDVMSMAHSLECRPVLLDHELVEVALSLPDNFKVRGDLKKAIFVDAVKDLIPGHVYNRRKTGFEMPFRTWLNGPLKESVAAALSSPAAKELLSESYLKTTMRQLHSGTVKREVWGITVFLNWLQQTKLSLP